jgi:hypothetical protein
MSNKSPMQRVKDVFGDKEKLVAALEKLTGDGLWIARTNENKGLAHVSNAKLLRLHATFTAVKEKFGSREKLIDALLELQKRAKDTGLRQKLSAWPVPRLYDAYRSAAKRHAHASSAAATPKAAAKPAKAEKTAKAPAKKKAAAKPPAA